MTNPGDKHDGKHEDQALAAWLDGRDGVSAAYRQTAHEEPPPALDRAILQAAREAVQPQATSRNTTQSDARASRNLARKPYALAASVMVAIAGLSLYTGLRDEVALQPGDATVQRVIEREAPAAPAPSGTPAHDASAAADVREAQQVETESQRASADAQAAEAERSAASAFEQRQLAPALPTVGASPVETPASPPAPVQRRETFARSEEAPVVVIDGPFLEQIEAEADAAQARAANGQLEEIAITGSRIMRVERTRPAYRASRDEWLGAMRALVSEIERRSRLATAQRNAAVLENQLEDEIALFLEAYPDTNIDVELGLAE